MGIEISYTNYEVKDSCNNQEILNCFTRDISWGTYTEDLKAIEAICGTKMKDYEPSREPVFIAEENREFKVTFRDDFFNFESEGVDHFIGTVAGDVALYSGIKDIEVNDFNFTSNSYQHYFKGPNVGINNLYANLLKNTLAGAKRPILAYSVKPRMGLNTHNYKEIYIEAVKGGVDIIEDDERLIDPLYCPFEERIKVMSEIQAQHDTTRFSANITGPVDKMLRRLELAYKQGLRIVKVDVLVTGFDDLKTITDFIRNSLNSEVAVTCYPDANGIYRKLSRTFILKMARLCGADIIYTSTPNWARMDDEFSESKFRANVQDIERKKKYFDLLRAPIQNIDNIKETLPTVSNGCDISRAELTQFVLRREFSGYYQYAYFVGGGISGFPAKLKDAVKEWMSSIQYTAEKSVDDFSNYKYKFRSELEANGLRLFDLKKELGK